MIYFSESGIQELQTLVNQVMPFLCSDDAEILWIICSEISLSHSVSSSEYQRIIGIVDHYPLRADLTGEKDSCAANDNLQHNYEHCPELSGEEEAFLMFRYFLLSYSGIECLNKPEIYPGIEQHHMLEPQIGG